jgi:hypothetical protein
MGKRHLHGERSITEKVENGANGISDMEGKAVRVAASERSRGDASDIDGQTERSKWAGAHESTRATSEFQLMIECWGCAGVEKPQFLRFILTHFAGLADTCSRIIALTWKR